MTKDRARKQAARGRAAITGERYVVARRAVADVEPPRDSWLHEVTHKVPGVPAHVDGGLQARAPRGRRTPTRASHNQRRHGEPRILVAWQNRIAKQFRVGSQQDVRK